MAALYCLDPKASKGRHQGPRAQRRHRHPNPISPVLLSGIQLPLKASSKVQKVSQASALLSVAEHTPAPCASSGGHILLSLPPICPSQALMPPHGLLPTPQAPSQPALPLPLFPSKLAPRTPLPEGPVQLLECPNSQGPNSVWIASYVSQPPWCLGPAGGHIWAGQRGTPTTAFAHHQESFRVGFLVPCAPTARQ